MSAILKMNLQEAYSLKTLYQKILIRKIEKCEKYDMLERDTKKEKDMLSMLEAYAACLVFYLGCR